jgi:hypothetical protein
MALAAFYGKQNEEVELTEVAMKGKVIPPSNPNHPKHAEWKASQPKKERAKPAPKQPEENPIKIHHLNAALGTTHPDIDAYDWLASKFPHLHKTPGKSGSKLMDNMHKAAKLAGYKDYYDFEDSWKKEMKEEVALEEAHTHSNARNLVNSMEGRGKIDGTSEKQSGGAVEKSWTKTKLKPETVKTLQDHGHRVSEVGNGHVIATYKGKRGEALRKRYDMGYDDMIDEEVENNMDIYVNSLTALPWVSAPKQIDELSNETLSKVIDKAGDKIDDPTTPSKKKTKHKRAVDIAFGKLYTKGKGFNEEVDLQEMSKDTIKSMLRAKLTQAKVAHAKGDEETATDLGKRITAVMSRLKNQKQYREETDLSETSTPEEIWQHQQKHLGFGGNQTKAKEKSTDQFLARKRKNTGDLSGPKANPTDPKSNRPYWGEDVELQEGWNDHISNVIVHHHGSEGYGVTIHTDDGKKFTEHHPNHATAQAKARQYHKASGGEAKYEDWTE